MNQDCVFCKIVSGELPSHKVWEDEKHLAFLNIFPNTPGFTIVATKKHYPSYAFSSEDQVLVDLILASKKVAKILDGTFKEAGRSGMFLEGLDVDHLHSKLIPMHGLANSNWRDRINPERGKFHGQFPGFMISQDSKRANDQELAKIAERLRETAKKLNL
jgi:diadenosine tetraphosphate (Ap4A) HIT family hydrolase